jgi:hypothetical protein
MYSKLPIQVKAARPTVTAIVDDDVVEEVQQPKFNIVHVSVEKQYTDPLSWKMYLVDENGRTYEYDLHFS